ncbi:Uncharacterised protein [uncultured Ruminococcus sp.]|jgi:hypothetical protein|nr:Uncharacterised protein [uncultured Ruminococcus sp.]
MLSAVYFIQMRRLGSFLFHVAMNDMEASDKMFAILDESIGNHDSLNEAVILKVLRDEGAGRTVEVVWVCHVVYFVFGVKIIREEE